MVKKKPVAKKAKKPTPVKKAVRRAIKSKVSPAEALAKWYGAYTYTRCDVDRISNRARISR